MTDTPFGYPPTTSSSQTAIANLATANGSGKGSIRKDERTDHLLEFHGTHGFHQMMIEPGLPATPAILVLAVTGNGDQEHLRAVVSVPQLPRHFVTILARESNIEQDYVRAVLCGQFDRLITVVSRSYVVTHGRD